MARASCSNVFLRLPPSAAFLLLAAVLGTSDGHALPRQTKTVELRELNVVAWPLLPTEAPIPPAHLFRRQPDNTICGYVGGNTDSPATCAPGAHCALDTENGYVGCCPNDGPCSVGIYTGCVDGNSDPQTEVNPYVYTCAGSDVCYTNQYPGNYLQYGCGTASDLGTTVQTSIQDATTRLDLPQISVSLTGTPISLSEPTTIGSATASSATASPSRTRTSSASSSTATASSTTTSTSSTRTSSSATTSSTDSTISSTRTSSTTSSSTTSLLPTEAPPTSEDNEEGGTNTGAIVGGTLGGIAGLAIIAAMVFFCLRKRRGNGREGPGPAPAAPPVTEYTSPIHSHGAAFAPLPSWQDEQADNANRNGNDNGNGNGDGNGDSGNDNSLYGNPYGNPYGNSFDQQQYPDSNTDGNGNGNYNTVPLVPPPQRYDPVHVAGVGTGLTPVEEETHETTTREIDDFSQAYSDARIGQVPSDEDLRPLTQPDPPNYSVSNYSDSNVSPIRGGHRPLWQQNRQRSRNLMWM